METLSLLFNDQFGRSERRKHRLEEKKRLVAVNPSMAGHQEAEEVRIVVPDRSDRGGPSAFCERAQHRTFVVVECTPPRQAVSPFPWLAHWDVYDCGPLSALAGRRRITRRAKTLMPWLPMSSPATVKIFQSGNGNFSQTKFDKHRWKSPISHQHLRGLTGNFQYFHREDFPWGPPMLLTTTTAFLF